MKDLRASYQQLQRATACVKLLLFGELPERFGSCTPNTLDLFYA